jgi:hypothetical protein
VADVIAIEGKQHGAGFHELSPSAMNHFAVSGVHSNSGARAFRLMAAEHFFLLNI